jgi:hypothetical protein
VTASYNNSTGESTESNATDFDSLPSFDPFARFLSEDNTSNATSLQQSLPCDATDKAVIKEEIEPIHSEGRGGPLYTLHVGEPSLIRVIACDRNGKRLRVGGANFRATLCNPSDPAVCCSLIVCFILVAYLHFIQRILKNRM